MVPYPRAYPDSYQPSYHEARVGAGIQLTETARAGFQYSETPGGAYGTVFYRFGF
jgi:hypothetical protein